MDRSSLPAGLLPPLGSYDQVRRGNRHGGRSTELGAETDVPLSHAVEHDVDAAAAEHPLQPVIAVLALEHARLDQLRDHLEALHALRRRLERRGDARTRTRA